jgi:hypothetical protein
MPPGIASAPPAISVATRPPLSGGLCARAVEDNKVVTARATQMDRINYPRATMQGFVDEGDGVAAQL